MQGIRNQHVFPLLGQRRIERQRQGDQPELSVTGLHELRGLRDVFAVDQLLFQRLPKLAGAQRFFGTFAVGRVFRVGGGDARGLAGGASGREGGNVGRAEAGQAEWAGILLGIGLLAP